MAIEFSIGIEPDIPENLGMEGEREQGRKRLRDTPLGSYMCIFATHSISTSLAGSRLEVLDFRAYVES